MEDITRNTHITITYNNPKTDEYEQYKGTIADVEDAMNGMLNTEALIAKLTSEGVAVMDNGFGTTTVAIGEVYHYHDTGDSTSTHSPECFDLTRSEVDAHLYHESDEFRKWIRGNPVVGDKLFGESNDVARVERIS